MKLVSWSKLCKSNLSLYSPYYAEACNEFAVPYRRRRYGGLALAPPLPLEIHSEKCELFGHWILVKTFFLEITLNLWGKRGKFLYISKILVWTDWFEQIQADSTCSPKLLCYPTAMCGAHLHVIAPRQHSYLRRCWSGGEPFATP